MKVMVVGSGGREHAIIKALKKSRDVEEIFALPGNGGMAADATCVNIAAKDIPAIVNFAKEKKIDYAVVAPDDPLVLGAVDALNDVGVPCFGPNKAAAIIEGSKVFSKNFMKKYGIPTAKYEVFSDMDEALKYLEDAPIPTVVKADGLALGKGVIICMTREEAKDAVKSMMQDKVFGESGANVVIEEFLTGPEVSVLSFTDEMCIRDRVDADVVIGVPDSGLDAAVGYSEASGIPYGIGLIKNKYIGRTFIAPGQKSREDLVRIKLNPIKSVVDGKRIVLIDDSIVRGTTSARIVKILRDAGAKEVHFRVSAPPFVGPCYYGTDIDSKDMLIACNHTLDEIRDIIGVDSIGYLSLESVKRLCGEDRCDDFCTACFDEQYPTKVPTNTQKNRFEQKISESKKENEE